MNAINVLKGIKNPKQFIMNNIMPSNSNPMINNLMEMAKKGDVKGVENFARNICKQRRIGF